jgi:hypothetical protein
VILGNIDSFDQTDGYARFFLQNFGSFDAEQIGAPAEYLMSLAVDPDDTARLGGTLLWQPSRYIGSAIEQEALQQTQLPDFSAVLSDVAKCGSLTLPGYTGCDTTCMQQLCVSALDSRWAKALEASGQAFQWAELPFEASGMSDYDDDARLIGFEGSWLGNVLSDQLTAQVMGAVVADAAVMAD